MSWDRNALAIILCLSVPAFAQTSPGFVPGQVLGAEQLNNAFIAKQDFPASTGGPANLVDHSGTIALGGASQTLMIGNAARRGCHIQNLSSADLWINQKGAAAIAGQPSMWLPAGSDYVCPASGASVSQFTIFGGITGQAFVAEEW